MGTAHSGGFSSSLSGPVTPTFDGSPVSATLAASLAQSDLLGWSACEDPTGGYASDCITLTEQGNDDTVTIRVLSADACSVNNPGCYSGYVVAARSEFHGTVTDYSAHRLEIALFATTWMGVQSSAGTVLPMQLVADSIGLIVAELSSITFRMDTYDGSGQLVDSVNWAKWASYDPFSEAWDERAENCDEVGQIVHDQINEVGILQAALYGSMWTIAVQAAKTNRFIELTETAVKNFMAGGTVSTLVLDASLVGAYKLVVAPLAAYSARDVCERFTSLDNDGDTTGVGEGEDGDGDEDNIFDPSDYGFSEMDDCPEDTVYSKGAECVGDQLCEVSYETDCSVTSEGECECDTYTIQTTEDLCIPAPECEED